MYQDTEITEDIVEIVKVAIKVATVVVAAGGAILAALEHKDVLNGGRNKTSLRRLMDDY